MFKVKLYQHQIDAVDFLAQRNFTGAIFADMGTGKSLMGLESFRQLRLINPGIKMVVCAPLSLLEAAWGSDITKFTKFSYYNAHDKPLPIAFSEDILLINYDAVITKRAAGLIKLVQGNLLVADECFDGNTLIDTPRGKKKIKDIKIGDCIINCTGIDKVIGTRIKKLDRRLKIKYNNKWIQCSLNHPFLTINGWILAHNLKKGDYLVKTKYAMSMVQERITRENLQQIREKDGDKQESFLQYILFGEMENDATGNQRKYIYSRSSKKDIDRIKQIYDVFTKKRTQSQGKTSKQNVSSGSKKKGIGKIKDDKMETRITGRQWKTFIDSTKQTCKITGKDVGNRICGTDKRKKSVSYQLQNRYRLSSDKNRNRSRWIFPSNQKSYRSEKRQFIKFFRVEDIKIYKQRSNGKPRRSIKQDIFYDLQIENHPSFSVNGVLVHNSSRMKNNQARTTKFMLALGKIAKYRVIMSGTPAPNSPQEYWGQIEFLRPKYLHVSGSFYAFRNSYFHLQRGHQIMHGQHVTKVALYDAFRTGFKYEITQKNLEKLMAKINPLAYRIRKEECLDLPEQVDEVRYVYLGSKTLKHYKEMKNDLITEIKHEMITAEMALTKIMKLREITSGFIMDANAQAIDIGGGEKLSEIKEIIEELGDQPVIIWCCFRWEMKRIHQELDKIYGAGSCVVLNSETQDRDQSIQDFKEGKARFAICHPASVAHGITWVNCSVEVFFSLDYSLERYLQARARIHRIGQVNKCTYIHLLAKGTIDEDVLAVLKNKGKMVEMVEQLMRRG